MNLDKFFPAQIECAHISDVLIVCGDAHNIKPKEEIDKGKNKP